MYVVGSSHTTEARRTCAIIFSAHTKHIQESGEKQQTLTVIMRKCSEAKTKAIDELLVDVVTMDVRALAIVEGEGMHRLINYLEPGYRLPSRKHITRICTCT